MMNRFIGILLISSLLSGCVTMRRDSFTAVEHSRAEPGGFSNVRYVPGESARSVAQGRLVPRTTPETMLALSGGGAGGAYGAGVLQGWTETGTRPQFSVVTGVSTGALIAPSAFLGPAWDGELKRAFTDGRASQLLAFPGFRALTEDSLFSGRPLRRLMASYVSDRMIAAVAAEHARGRQLLIATADLDTQQLVVWNMGAIASHGGPAARALFTQVLVAAASIPGVFPPVMIEAEIGGRKIREMHVDAGMISAFFAVPEEALLTMEGAPAAGGTIYILVNGKVDEEFMVTRHALLPVLARSYDTATKASWRASLSQVAVFGKTNGLKTHVSIIPSTAAASTLDFSRKSMLTLFELGRSRARSGDAWSDLRQSLARR